MGWEFTAGSLGDRGVPSGALFPYAGAAAPTGYLICDGAAVSRTTYADLFAAISTNYGVGDGSTTFNLPDLQGRMAVGKGTHVDVDALNDSDGLAVGSRRPKHYHKIDTRDGSGSTYLLTGAGNNVVTPYYTSPATGDHRSAPASTPQDSPAYLVTNYIIKT